MPAAGVPAHTRPVPERRQPGRLLLACRQQTLTCSPQEHRSPDLTGPAANPAVLRRDEDPEKKAPAVLSQNVSPAVLRQFLLLHHDSSLLHLDRLRQRHFKE